VTRDTIETARLLVVSHDPAVLRPLWLVGAANCWEFESAANAWEAIERVQAGVTPDLLLLDLPHGDADALHILRWLRRLRPALPIILIGHSDDIGRKEEAIRMGARDYLVRPFDDQQLELAREYKGLGGDKPLPGTSSAHDRFVRASYYFKYLPGPANYRAAVAGVLSVMLNVSAPFGVSEPGKPNISATIFRTVADLTNGIYYYQSALSPNIVWLDLRKLNLAAGAALALLFFVLMVQGH